MAIHRALGVTLTLFLLFVAIHFQPASATHQPRAHLHTEVSALDSAVKGGQYRTNAERLAAGLPPLPPTRRSRRAVPRSEPSGVYEEPIQYVCYPFSSLSRV